MDQPQPGILTVQYKPVQDDDVFENPPRFSWLPDIDESVLYVLRIRRNGDEEYFTAIRRNFFTPSEALAPGSYSWSYAIWDDKTRKAASEWSEERRFELAGGLPETPLPDPKARRKAAGNGHPRLWLNSDGIEAFHRALGKNPDHCAWQEFYEKSVAPWLQRDVIAEPDPYPGNTRTAAHWRQTYIDCQEAIYGIRHLSVAGRILKDDAILDKARQWLLEIAAWDVQGPTSRGYNDEAGFRVATALAWGYDWLYDHLSQDERDHVAEILLIRTREIADHVISSARIHIFPYDSHAVRALSAALTACCIALLDESDEARGWLDYTVEYLSTLYSPWADSDGGWAEGPHYWMTGMAYLIDAANLIRNALQVDLYKRPFFQSTGDFPLYTKAPDTRRACFGDDSTLGDLPCLKVGHNLRQFAGVTGNGVYQWYFEEVKRNDPGTEHEFYNYGWWDFNFDELRYRHDFPSVEARAPDKLPMLKNFRGIGWAAIQKNMADPDEHIQFVMKSSPYGSVSHSHADQNAFLLYAYGEDLAIQSGYYVAFGSDMHLNWRRQTVSKNALLIDGKGQYAGMDKALQRRAAGRILEARETDGNVFIRGDATEAYRPNVPELTSCQRDIHFVDKSYFVIVDRVELSKSAPIEWLFHSGSQLELGKDVFRLKGKKAALYGQFVFSEAGPVSLSQVEGFPGIDPDEYEGLPNHWHLKASVPAAASHTLVTLLVPHRVDRPLRIFNFLDDQGFDNNVYFVNQDDRQYSIKLQKHF